MSDLTQGVEPKGFPGTIGNDLSWWGYFVRAIKEKYATFTGRANRKEYWSFVLFYLLFFVLAALIGGVLDEIFGNLQSPDPQAIFTVVSTGLFSLALFLPGLAVYVRRLHDIGLSGWLSLVAFLPYVGGIFVLVTALIPSQAGPNKYGAAPD